MRDFFFVVIWCLSSLSSLLLILGAVARLDREDFVVVVLELLVGLLGPACGFGVALILQGGPNP